MKKLEALLRRETLDHFPEFKRVHQAFVQARQDLAAAKAARQAAKQQFLASIDSKDFQPAQRLELQLRYRREKYFWQYRREAYRIAKLLLKQWLDQFKRPGKDAPIAAEAEQPTKKTGKKVAKNRETNGN